MESFISNLKHQVQCSLCNETLIEPKLLQCFHTFCKSCIKRHAQLTEEVNIFKCPQCTSQTLLQELNDVEDLQTSPVPSRILQVLSFVENQKICSVSSSHSQAICHCLECDRSFCEECLANHSEFTKNHQVVALSDLKKEDIERMLKRESPCKTHDNQDVDLYCNECDKLICVLCLKDHHRNHKTASLQEFIDNEKDLISKNLEAINKMSTDEKEKKQQEEVALLIKRYGEKAKEQLKKLTKKLAKALHDNEQQHLNEIQKTITKAEKNLRIIRHSTEAQEYIKCFVQNGTASEMIDTRDGKCPLNFTYNPFERISAIEFKPNEELCEQVKTGLGVVRSFNKADPKMSSVKVEPSNIHAMNKARLAVELRTSEGEVTVESLENITILFTPEDDVKVKEIQMTDDSKTITVDFIPRVAGQLTADIQVNGDSVSNSPLVMVVKPQQMKEMTGNSKLKDALNTGSEEFTGIAVNKTNSKIAVADFESHCVRVFNMEGDLLLTYGSEGRGQGQLKYPHGLAFLNEIYLIIVDNNNDRICIVNTTTGKLVTTFGCKGNGNGQFNNPYGVHVDDDSNIIVCDCWNNRVQVFTKDGGYKYQFSVPLPYCTVTHNGLFYVSDYNNSVVHVIEMKDNQSPTTVTTIGGKDYTDGQLQKPLGLAIDNDNNLLVCGKSLIHKFTLDGRYVGQSSKLTYQHCYIAVLNDGQVFCTTGEGGVRKLDNM